MYLHAKSENYRHIMLEISMILLSNIFSYLKISLNGDVANTVSARIHPAISVLPLSSVAVLQKEIWNPIEEEVLKRVRFTLPCGDLINLSNAYPSAQNEMSNFKKRAVYMTTLYYA